MNDVIVDGIAIAVHPLGGNEASPPLLISHATGFHGRAYQPFADALADRYRPVAFDHRGHGATPPTPAAHVDWRDFGRDTAAVATAVAPGGLVAFGHSMGAATLLLAALDQPELFARLVVFEPIAFPPDAASNPLAEGARRRRRSFPSLSAAYERYASRPPLGSFTPAALQAYVEFGFAPDDSPDAEPGSVTLRCTPEIEAATYEAATTTGLWQRLGDVAVPVTVIGSGDGQAPAAVAPEIARRIPGATFVSMPDADHFGPFNDPSGVARLVT